MRLEWQSSLNPPSSGYRGQNPCVPDYPPALYENQALSEALDCERQRFSGIDSSEQPRHYGYHVPPEALLAA